MIKYMLLLIIGGTVKGVEEKTCSNDECAIKLTYFDVKARAEPIRIALRQAKLEFIDERLTYESWIGGIKAATPSGSLPVLSMNGKTYSQSVAIARWAAKQSNLYPRETLAGLTVDEVMDITQEVLTKAPSASDPTEKERLRKEYASGFMKNKMNFLESKLKQTEGPFVLGSEISIADLVLYYFLMDMLRSGQFDFVDSNYIDAFPELAALETAVKTSPLLNTT